MTNNVKRTIYLTPDQDKTFMANYYHHCQTIGHVSIAEYGRLLIQQALTKIGKKS